MDDINIVVDDKKDDTVNEVVIQRISEIADTIDPSIKSTYDCGSKYQDGRLPMLDLKLWIGKDSKNKWKLMHTHYIKDVSSRYLIHARSSHPYTMKLNVLVNESLRILRNTSLHLEWNESRKHLQYFVYRMQFSGYDQEIRTKVLQKALRKNDEKLRKYDETGRMYQTRKEKLKERRTINEVKKRNWYNREKYDGVLFVDVTENGELLREVKKIVKRNDMKVKVVEKMKSTLKSRLQRSNPFKTTGCRRLDCCICNQKLNVDCRTRGCVYEITCKDCLKVYIGQTGRSMYERMKEHLKAYEVRSDKSVLWEHSKKFHGNQEFEFDTKVKSKCFGEPTTRLITEAVMIDKLNDAETLNSRNEWSYVRLPRASIT